MSDETVAQARRARIEALNEILVLVRGFEKRLSEFGIDRGKELQRLLDHEKAPDPEEAGARITEAVRLANEEATPKEHQLITHQRLKLDELEKRIGEREQQIARLLDTVASQEAAIRDYQDENSTFQERNRKLAEQVDNLSGKVVQLNQVIDQKDTEIALQEDEIEVLKGNIARQSETIVALRQLHEGVASETIQMQANEIGRLVKLVEARDDEIARIVDQDTEAERWKEEALRLQKVLNTQNRIFTQIHDLVSEEGE